MERNRIARRCPQGGRGTPSNQLRSSEQVLRRRGQGGRVQRLAYVASAFRAARMVVECTRARSQVEQRDARNNCEPSPPSGASEHTLGYSHSAGYQPSTISAVSRLVPFGLLLPLPSIP
jgi:hypothetical protein